jgi:hypothetical protein
MKRFVLLIAVLALPGIAEAQDFLQGHYSAEQVILSDNRTRTSKVYVDGGKIRAETTIGPAHIISIVRPDKNVVYMLMPAQKMYAENPIGDAKDWLTQASGKNTKRELLGTETVQGQRCDKYRVSSEHGAVFFWINKDTNTPVQLESADKIMRMEWRNVQVGPQPASLFEPPADYTKAADFAPPAGMRSLR